MRHTSLVLLPLVIAAAACAKGKGADTAASDDLKRDLQLASAPKLELASSQKSFDRTDVVSAIEKNAAAAPQGNSAPHYKPKARQEAAPAPAVASTDAAPEVVAMSPEPAPVQAPAPIAPVAGPRPTAPTSIIVDATDARGSGDSGGGWGGIGSVIGVVVRGGVMDGDHCDPRADRRRRGGGIFVNDRMPGGMGGMGGMTFPRR